MSDDIHEPEPADDDIPVLTDIVVPGRLRSANPTTTDATSVGRDFVFDIDFEDRNRGVEFPSPPAAPPSPAAPTSPAPDSEPEEGADLDLPLPWAESTPQSTTVPEPVARPGRTEPLITAAVAKAAEAVIEPPDADAQALLRELLAEIGAGLEQRLALELAATEQRLRAALREELDTRLSELLAGAIPKP